ncbi:MAG: 4Fe-4S dicluster domain-containing protein [Crenarchaeota archaeon]|nr:4Fe-4S dicluster domain-containing protein [Thermoproteota archaeon]
MPNHPHETGTPEETYQGIPRSKISWGPTIDYTKCISCGKCADFCHVNVFTIKEENGKKHTIVKNYNNCIVFCKGCEDICPVGAISHPNDEETQSQIDKLEKKK